jgi:uncharacterized protein involved in copper resistance
MMNKLTVIASATALVSSGAALAHQHKAGTSHKAGANQSQKCEMMKDGKKMPGMMQKGADGKMSCHMMDHSKMDHSKMGHGLAKTEPAKPE